MAVRLRRLTATLFARLALAAALLVVTALSAFLTMRSALSMHAVLVPPVVGKRAAEAGAILADQGLTMRIVGRRHDPNVPASAVAVQEPAARTTLKANRTVRVWLSLGPRRTETPSLVGTSVRSARLALDLAGIPLARVAEVPSRTPEGEILLQRPMPGTIEDNATGGVSLLVSRGPSGFAFVMPDLIGRNVDDVVEALRLVGLKVTDIRSRPYPGRAPGTIVGQSPKPGFRVGPRAAITLDIIKDAS